MLYIWTGSAKEAEKFDHLPPEESKKRLLLLLSKIDVDNNKFVDAKELFEWIVKSFKLVLNKIYILSGHYCCFSHVSFEISEQYQPHSNKLLILLLPQGF